jgi:diaminopimelate epimerase
MVIPTELRFVEMQACGNDFVVLDGITKALELGDCELRQLAVRMSNRCFGVGAGGEVVRVLLAGTAHRVFEDVCSPDQP